MSATVTVVTNHGHKPMQPLFVHKLTVAYLTLYPTGGEPLGLATKLPGKTIIAVHAQPTALYVFGYNVATDSLIAYDGTLTEVVAGTDLTGTSTVVTVFAE